MEIGGFYWKSKKLIERCMCLFITGVALVVMGAFRGEFQDAGAQQE